MGAKQLVPGFGSLSQLHVRSAAQAEVKPSSSSEAFARLEQLGEQGLAEPLQQWLRMSSEAKHNCSPERDTLQARSRCHLCAR